jgi:diguanylate cyclase (GGDEF)-like protein
VYTRLSLTLLARHAAVWISLAMLSPAGWADESADLDRLESIYRTALQNQSQALAQLQAFASQLAADTPYAVRVELLRTRIPLLGEAGQVANTDADIAELLRLGQQHQDLSVIVQAQAFAAGQLIEADRPDQALNLLLEARTLADQSGNPIAKLAWNRAMGDVYSKLGNFEKALGHLLAALRLSEQQPKRQTKAKVDQLNSLGTLYWTMKEPKKSVEYLDQALALAPQVGSVATMTSLKINRANALTDLARPDHALADYQDALRLSRTAGLIESETVVLINLADHYLRLRQFDLASTYAKQALSRAEKTGSKANRAIARANLGLAMAGQGNLRGGVPHIHAAIAIYHDTGARADEEGLLEELSEMYEKAGLYRDALAAARRQTKLSREIFQADQAKAISTLQEQFNAEQRQRQIEILAHENRLKDAELVNRQLQQTVTLLAAIATLMGAAFILMLYRRVRQANRRLAEANSQLEFQSVRDPLTGLFNRRSFLDLMKRRAVATEGGRRDTTVVNQDGLMILDIDHFKHINDAFGHASGDAVLVEVAQRLRATVRESDMVLRWGGEEFLVYSPRAHPLHLEGLARRLLDAIGGVPVVVGGQSIAVTVTAGFIALPYSNIPESQCNWERVLQIADMALYLGKVNGRNRAYGVGPLRVAPEVALPVLDHDLSAALQGGMVELTEVVGPAQPGHPAT